MEILKDIILDQYYKIEEYVHNSSDIVQMKINDFISGINNTSIFIENLVKYIYIKVLGYYKILHCSIQNKYKVINDNRRLELNSLEKRKMDSNELNIMKNDFSELYNLINSQIKEEIRNYTRDKLHDIYNTIDNKLKKISDKLYKKVTYKGQVGIPFPILPFFEVVFSYYVYAGMGVNIALTTKTEEDLLPVLTFDAFAEARVDLYIDAGFYIPSSSSPVCIKFIVGLGGTVGDGRAGIKLEISFMERTVDFDVYFTLKVFRFSFYFRIGIYIDIKFYKFDYEFDIVRYEFKGFEISYNDPKNQKLDKKLSIK
jgi:hypothetical protein